MQHVIDSRKDNPFTYFVVLFLYQMLILKTKLTRGQWGGIAIVIVALAMVGASSALVRAASA
jgi:hypothetical protein